MTRTQLLYGGGLILSAALFMGAQLPPSSPAPAPPEPPAAPVMPEAAAGAMKPAPAMEPVEPFGEFGSFEGGGSSYLGIDTQDVTPQRMAPLKLKEERGVEVLTVDQDAPAGKAGLKEHDVILEFNGNKVEGVEHLRRMIHEIPPGRTATVAVSRDGKPMLFKVQLADKTQAMRMSGTRKIMVPRPVVPDFDFPAVDVMVQTSGSRSGAVVENLTPQLGDYFGARNGEGVLVRSVEKGSAAEAAGLRAGDVIVRVENERINDRGDWKTALRNHRRGKVSVGIIRDKKEQTISITMPDAKDDSSFEVMPFGDESEDMDAHTHVVAHLDREQQRQIREATRRAQEQVKQEMKKQSEELKKHSEEMKRMQREIKMDWNFGTDSEL
jgi:membrane-associated protease RseP (regulator of RpoE activity)